MVFVFFDNSLVNVAAVSSHQYGTLFGLLRNLWNHFVFFSASFGKYFLGRQQPLMSLQRPTKREKEIKTWRKECGDFWNPLPEIEMSTSLVMRLHALPSCRLTAPRVDRLAVVAGATTATSDEKIKTHRQPWDKVPPELCYCKNPIATTISKP